MEGTCNSLTQKSGNAHQEADTVIVMLMWRLRCDFCVTIVHHPLEDVDGL